MPGAHALLSASGASRWIACPPSARLESNFPETTSSYAEEGTMAHTLAEKMILRQLGRLLEKDYKKALDKLKAQEEIWKDEMMEHCMDYTTIIMEIFNEEKGSKIFLENRLDLTTYIPEGFGTSDANILRPKQKKLIVADLKYGKGVPVSAIENKQGKVYSLGALERYDFIYDIETVEFVIHQPRLGSISRFEMDAKELRAWGEDELKPAAEKAWWGQGSFNPGDACRFCGAKAQCRALHDHNRQLTIDLLDDKQTSLKPGPLLTDEEIGRVLNESDLFTEWIGAVEKYAFAEAVSKGKKWPGFKLVEGLSRRKYTDENAIRKILDEKGITDYNNVKLKGFGDMADLIGSKKDFESLLKDYLLKPPGAPALVPESDKRPEWRSADKVKKLLDD